MVIKLNINWLNKCWCGNRMHTVETVRGSHVRLFEDDAVKCNSCGRKGVIQTCDGIATVLWETDEERADGAAMTKSTITRERLEKIKSWRETYGAGSNVMLPAEEAEELARIALVSLDAEIMHCTHGAVDNEDGVITCRHCGKESTNDQYQLTGRRISELLESATEYDLTAFAKNDDLALALRELQERRKADSEPVATLDVQSRRPDGNKFALVFSSAAHKLPDDVYFLYRHAQPAPVVPDERYQHLSELYHAQEKRLFKLLKRVKGPEFDKYSHTPLQAIDFLESAFFGDSEDDARAAMLQAGDTVSGNSFSDLDLEGMSHGNNPQANAYRELLAYRRNSPVIPDGYVMVPKEPTDDMCFAPDVPVGNKSWDGYQSSADMAECKAIYEAMLAAAPQPQNEPQNIPGWIPVSERMPEDSGTYQVWNGKHVGAVPFLFGSFQCLNPEQVTHWMPTAKPPLEMKP